MMSTSTAPATALRTLHRQLFRQSRRTSTAFPPSRALSASHSRLADPTPTSPRPPPPRQPTLQSDLLQSLRKSPVLRSTTEPYIAYGATEDLFKACAATCNYTVPTTPAPKNDRGEDVGEGTGWWFDASSGAGLPVTFNIWAQVMYLHMYILTTRLRAFPKEHVRIWEQNLLDHFFYAAEDRMAMFHGMAAKGVRNKYLKDLWVQWRGVLLSYDEGLVKGDAVLAAAVWRNIWQASEEADVGNIATVVAYLRQEIARLGTLPNTDEKITAGAVVFGSPADVAQRLEGMQSVWTGRTFTQEDLLPLKEAPQA